MTMAEVEAIITVAAEAQTPLYQDIAYIPAVALP
jgi:hypothetical protein